ncbi:phage integrase N-terminal SAM-like domain-containing protein [Methylosoma difficile]
MCNLIYTPPNPPPKLLDLVRDRLRVKHYSFATEKLYVHWVIRFILFHGKRHPQEMGAAEVEAFLTHLAVEGQVAACTQNQALSALAFLYKAVLNLDLPWLKEPQLLMCLNFGVQNMFWTPMVVKAVAFLGWYFPTSNLCPKNLSLPRHPSLRKRSHAVQKRHG